MNVSGPAGRCGRKYCADESLGIKNDNTFARKGFFLRYISLENKQAKLELFFLERIHIDK